jgi:hypothetical protein
MRKFALHIGRRIGCNSPHIIKGTLAETGNMKDFMGHSLTLPESAADING